MRSDNAPARGALPLTTRWLPEQALWVGRRPSITEREREREGERGGGEQMVTAPTNDSFRMAHRCSGKRQTSYDIAQHQPLSYKPAN